METVELKLAEWRKLHGELNEAQLSLREARARRPAGNATTAQLEARVKRLQEESNGALDAVHAALGSRNARYAAPS